MQWQPDFMSEETTICIWTASAFPVCNMHWAQLDHEKWRKLTTNVGGVHSWLILYWLSQICPETRLCNNSAVCWISLHQFHFHFTSTMMVLLDGKGMLLDHMHLSRSNSIQQGPLNKAEHVILIAGYTNSVSVFNWTRINNIIFTTCLVCKSHRKEMNFFTSHTNP